MGKHSHLIHTGKDQPLDAIPFHADIRSLDRIAWEGFPMHLAVHHVNGIDRMPERYVEAHAHEKPEVNIIMSDGELVYEIGLGDETYKVAAPAAIWIPPGLPHTANVISGSGYFVCMILGNRYKDEGASDEPTGVPGPVKDSD